MAKRKAKVDEVAKDAGDGSLPNKDYEKELKKLHVELVKLQEWVKHKGLKVCIVFEGRDGAGKGGTIKAHHRAREPARVPRRSRCPRRPSARSRRCTSSATCPHLPAAGEIVIFDRSWYNRAGVERVMGFCTDEQVEATS